MHTCLYWKSRSLSSSHQIFQGDELIGELRDKTFKQSSEGWIGNKNYRFETKGFFNQETRIIELGSEQLIGEISYNSMMTKATIKLKDKSVHWKYDNTWQTRWSLYDNFGVHMKFSGSISGGSVECNAMDELLVLCGIFVTNYYQQATFIILAACFIPAWIIIFT